MALPQEGVGSLRVSSTQTNGTCVVALVGELDTATAPDLRGRLDKLITDGQTNIVLDLERVGFVDSTGLGVLVGALKHAHQAGGDIRLCSPRPSHLKVFEITGLDKVFEVVEEGHEER